MNTQTGEEGNPYQAPECVREPPSTWRATARRSPIGLDCAILSLLAGVGSMLLMVCQAVMQPPALAMVFGAFACVLMVNGAFYGAIGLVAGIRSRSGFIIALACLGCLFHLGCLLLMFVGIL